ncbi:MAG: hypothetical protein LBU42_04200 [Prevotellaceae bacterium]|jgi:hypothetical protein|nr:hypothetical protein [Prevotellaceae bacterium]
MNTTKFYTLLAVPTCAGEKTASELKSLIAQYPWFALAHQLLMETTFRRNEEERNEYAGMAAAYAASRNHFYWRLQQPTGADETNEEIDLFDEPEMPKQPMEEPKPPKKPFTVAGGDYFNSSDLNPLTATDNDPLSRFIVAQPKINPPTSPLDAIEWQGAGDNEPVGEMDYVTETLAKIYRSQQLYGLALETYEKLILQNPEKSAYFAAQIQEIKKIKP